MTRDYLDGMILNHRELYFSVILGLHQLLRAEVLRRERIVGGLACFAIAAKVKGMMTATPTMTATRGTHLCSVFWVCPYREPSPSQRAIEVSVAGLASGDNQPQQIDLLLQGKSIELADLEAGAAKRGRYVSLSTEEGQPATAPLPSRGR